jgi:GntR family transcriptional regulator
MVNHFFAERRYYELKSIRQAIGMLPNDSLFTNLINYRLLVKLPMERRPVVHRGGATTELVALEIEISPGTAVPIYRQIVERLHQAILTGQLHEGSQLPSVRSLAEQLVINPNTVARAYQELVRDGMALSQQGRGFYVAKRRRMYTKAECRRRLEEALDPFVAQVVRLDLTADEVLEAIRKRLDDYGVDGSRGTTS